ncbi:MAG: hypothetical protein JEZ06_23845, partial [Anaerolineaceae bacterium]|nr:hypothetical protein [Anaerolineaceae bacterium]
MRRRNSVFLHGNWKVVSCEEIDKKPKIIIAVQTEITEGWHPVQVYQKGFFIILAYALLQKVSGKNFKVTILSAFLLTDEQGNTNINAEIDFVEFHSDEKYKSEIMQIIRQIEKGLHQITVLDQSIDVVEFIRELAYTNK